MPRAEVGSTKYVANKMKSKGLQRLRWYCQACNKQCRDENGFKCHTQSESHVRQMMVIGENPNAHISEYSSEFLRAFVQQLKTAHGTKQVHINHFYQEYIHDKEHVHMNATKWKSLTEFAKYLGREGICRVEETEKGVHISWIDNSPAALKRQAAVQKQERIEKNDEQWEQRMLREQIARAQALTKTPLELKDDGQDLQRENAQNISFSLGSTSDQSKPPTPPRSDARSNSAGDTTFKMTLGNKTTPKLNVFAQKKSNPFAAMKKSTQNGQPKKMSEAERIMREEMERNRGKGAGGIGHPAKRQRLG